jgi:hypothetical protein
LRAVWDLHYSYFVPKGHKYVVQVERAESSRVYEKKVDGDLEAKMVQLCCSEPPEGRARWTVRLLAEKLVELEYVDYLSHVSVHNTLKKTKLSHGKLKVG